MIPSDSTAPPTISDATNAVLRKVTWRIVPLFVLCFVMSYLDRVNVSFAKLQMQSELGLSEAAYGFGASIFFIGYLLFEVPSNIVLARVGSRRWTVRVAPGGHPPQPATQSRRRRLPSGRAARSPRARESQPQPPAGLRRRAAREDSPASTRGRCPAADRGPRRDPRIRRARGRCPRLVGMTAFPGVARLSRSPRFVRRRTARRGSAPERRGHGGIGRRASLRC